MLLVCLRWALDLQHWTDNEDWSTMQWTAAPQQGFGSPATHGSDMGSDEKSCARHRVTRHVRISLACWTLNIRHPRRGGERTRQLRFHKSASEFPDFYSSIQLGGLSFVSIYNDATSSSVATPGQAGSKPPPPPTTQGTEIRNPAHSGESNSSGTSSILHNGLHQVLSHSTTMFLAGKGR